MVSKALVVLLVGTAVGGAVAVAVAKSRMGPPPPPPPPPPTLSSLTLAATTATSIMVGGSVSFQGVAKDQNGSPMSGVTVQMRVGSVAVPGTVVTDATGTFTATLSFGTAGTFNVTAASGTVISPPVAITVTSLPPPPPKLGSLAMVAAASAVQVGGSIEFTITAKDTNGSLMGGVSGQILEGGTPVAGATFTTGASGTTVVTLQFAAVGTVSVSAQSGTVTSNAITITVTSAPPPPTNVLSVKWGRAPTTVVHGISSQWQALVNVKTGTSSAGIPVDFYLDGKLVYSANTVAAGGTLTQGVVYFNTALTVGTHTLYFTVPGTTFQSPTLTITAT